MSSEFFKGPDEEWKPLVNFLLNPISAMSPDPRRSTAVGSGTCAFVYSLSSYPHLSHPIKVLLPILIDTRFLI